MSIPMTARRLACIAGLVVAALVDANVLSEKDLAARLALFGDGFIVAKTEGPRIDEPAEWIGRQAGEYRYRFVSGSDDGALTHTERHIPDSDDPENGWERYIGERLVEAFKSGEDGAVLIVEEIDRKHGFRVAIEPGVHWPADVGPGDAWDVDSDLSVYRLATGEIYKRGTLRSRFVYEGAFRVRTPAGEFDAVLIREDFVIEVGPVKAEDDRFLFFAKGVGLVAEIEAIRASAVLVFRYKEDSAKVLESLPPRDT